MPSNYDRIEAENTREYGQGTRHLSFLGRLYTDRTHLVFELLQNAEDAGASKVLFQLLGDHLEVLHDGRLFDEKDVRGICGVGEGTKAEDFTQIGKFGIGFKSVYAYTSRPEVHSGDENFKIEKYVRPYAVEPRSIDDSWTTLFVFPFDKEEAAPETACREISGRLRNLSARGNYWGGNYWGRSSALARAGQLLGNYWATTGQLLGNYWATTGGNYWGQLLGTDFSSSARGTEDFEQSSARRRSSQE